MIFWLFLLCWGSISAQDKVTSEVEQFPDLQRKFDALTEKLNVLETNQRDIQTRLEKVTTPVIFSAATGGGNTAIGPFDVATTLIFRKEITNIGSAYNSATGVFAAPHNGVYYFTFFCHAGGDQILSLELYKNNEMIVETHDHKSTYDTADNGGNAVFLQLQQGDQVYIRLRVNAHVWGNDHVTTFSGFLVSQM